MVTWDTTVVIPLGVGRLVKWESDTLVLGMSKRIWWTQKPPRIIEIGGFKRLRGVTKIAHPDNRAY